KPTLYARGGFISEKTMDEDRAGPVATLEGRWNVYRGGRDELARQLSDSELKSVNLELAARIQILKFEVQTLFYQSLAAAQKKTLLREELASNELQRKVARKRAASGVATGADELEFDLRGQEIQSMLKTLESEEQKNLISLKNVVRIPLTDSVTVKGEFPKIESNSSSIDVGSNPSLLKLQNNLEILAQEKTRINLAYKPEVDAFANVGKIYPTETLKKIESVIGIIVSIPLYDGFQQRSAQELSRLAQERAQIDFQKVQSDIAALVQAIEVERKEIELLRDINEKRLSYAQKYLKVTAQEYDRGVKNSPDVVGALEHLFASRMRRIDLALQSVVLSSKRLSLSNVNGI
ncbi:MAG: TolC family protein, partial [Chitinophagaceae bacterium]|nr:TolC family protein [Oligoflexus sp.]